MNYKQIAVSVSGFQVESKVEALMYPLTEGRSELIGRLSELGLQADCSTGRIMYKDAFKALPLNYTLVFIRHGQTFANQEHELMAEVAQRRDSGGEVSVEQSSQLESLEKLGINPVHGRHYQGNVDEPKNQLNPVGVAQAESCRDRLLSVASGDANLEFPAAVSGNVGGVRSNLSADMNLSGWAPEKAFASPLGRAYQTGLPYTKTRGMTLFKIDGVREMNFGVIDNRQVKDPDIADNPCHRFYREQDALWQADGDGSESFSSMLLRASSVLKGINDIISESGEKNIIVFSHSMFGAACSVLTGNGIVMESEEGPHIAFDKSGVTFPHCTPTVLHVHKD